MKVVHIGHKYGQGNTGGAAIASTRLHRALLSAGVESHYVCVWQCEDGDNVHVLPTGWRRKAYLALTKLTRCFWKFTPYRRSITLNVIPLFGLEKLLRQIDPDVVHIQWINADVASFEQLGNLRRAAKPTCKVIFNLHDLYPLLGFDVHPRDNRYAEGYTSANSTRLERWLFARKQKMVAKLNPMFIGPSEYVAETCRKSVIGRGHEVLAISNIIDPIFKFHPEMCAPHDKFTILFGCYNGRSSSVKGWKDLVAALNLLPPELTEKIEVKVFGENGPDEVINGIPVKVLGIVTDSNRLLELYHQADVLAFPSVKETQGMAKCEALRCGMPVIVFKRTACAEGIAHGQTGWVANDGDAQQFADGIKWAFGQWKTGALSALRPTISKGALLLFDAQGNTDRVSNIYGLDAK